MAEAKVYYPDDLESKELKRILSRLSSVVLLKDEKILILFALKGFLGSLNCLLSTEDRIAYFNNTSGVLPKMFTVLYTDLESVTLDAEGKNQWILLQSVSGESMKIEIPAPQAETRKMFDFIQDYKEKGKAWIEEKLKTDAEQYNWKVEAIRGHKNLKNVEIDRNAQIKFNKKNSELNEKMAEIDRVGKEKIAANNSKLAEDLRLMHEKNEQKIERMAASRSLSHYKLDYCSGLGNNVPPAKAKITVNAREQILEIETAGLPTIQISFTDIKGSTVTTDVEIPPDDTKSRYQYYLHIQCVLNGQDTEIVFSNWQTPIETVDPIHQMNYIMQHIGEKITEYNARNAHYDQRAQELAAERQRLLAQRAGQIEQIKEMFQPGTPAAQPNTAMSAPSPAAVPASAAAPSVADEIKKFKELLDMGAITQEEFDAKKKQLLHL